MAANLAEFLPEWESERATTAAAMVFVHLLDGLRGPTHDRGPLRLARGWVRQVALETCLDDDPAGADPSQAHDDWDR